MEMISGVFADYIFKFRSAPTPVGTSADATGSRMDSVRSRAALSPLRARSRSGSIQVTLASRWKSDTRRRIAMSERCGRQQTISFQLDYSCQTTRGFWSAKPRAKVLGFRPERAALSSAVRKTAMSTLGPIVLQESFCITESKFSRPYTRKSSAHLGDHIIQRQTHGRRGTIDGCQTTW